MAEEFTLTLPLGFELQEFRFERILGHGGFGITYYAWDRNFEVGVAIKEYFPVDFAYRKDQVTVLARSSSHSNGYRWGLESFLREAQTLYSFRGHDHIVECKGYFEAHGTAYIVMEYAEGPTLENVLERNEGQPDWKPPSQLELRALLDQILSALETIHTPTAKNPQGVLHRDIKPANIIISAKDERVILIDFGAARQATHSRSRNVTQIVTAGYGPFEQYSPDASKQGPFTDIYAVGATIYRAIVKKEPPDAPMRVLDDSITPLSITYKGQYSQEFLAAIDASLAPMPKDRPQSVAAWRKMLGASPPPPGKGEPTKSIRELHKKHTDPDQEPLCLYCGIERDAHKAHEDLSANPECRLCLLVTKRHEAHKDSDANPDCVLCQSQVVDAKKRHQQHKDPTADPNCSLCRAVVEAHKRHKDPTRTPECSICRVQVEAHRLHQEPIKNPSCDLCRAELEAHKTHAAFNRDCGVCRSEAKAHEAHQDSGDLACPLCREEREAHRKHEGLPPQPKCNLCRKEGQVHASHDDPRRNPSCSLCRNELLVHKAHKNPLKDSECLLCRETARAHEAHEDPAATPDCILCKKRQSASTRRSFYLAVAVLAAIVPLVIGLMNRPPTLISVKPDPLQLLPLRGDQLLEVKASDPDGDPIRYTWRAGSRTVHDTDHFTYVPTAGGTVSVRFTDDWWGWSHGEEEVIWTVQAPPVDTPAPTRTSPPTPKPTATTVNTIVIVVPTLKPSDIPRTATSKPISTLTAPRPTSTSPPTETAPPQDTPTRHRTPTQTSSPAPDIDSLVQSWFEEYKAAWRDKNSSKICSMIKLTTKCAVIEDVLERNLTASLDSPTITQDGDEIVLSYTQSWMGKGAPKSMRYSERLRISGGSVVHTGKRTHSE